MVKKKVSLGTAILLCVLSIVTCIIPAFTLSAEESGERLVVGVPADRCPIFYIDDKTGEVIGLGVDLMREAAQNAGFAPTFTAIKEKNLKDALDNPEYDVILPFGNKIDSTKGNAIVISDDLMLTPFILVSTDDEPLPSLNNLTVGMVSSQTGSAEAIGRMYPGVRIELFDTTDECVRELRKGQVDALLNNSYVWSYILQKPAYSNLVIHPESMFTMGFRAGALDNARGQSIIDRLNAGIAKMPETQRQSVTLAYTSRQLYKYDLSDYAYKYGPVLALGLLLFISVIVISIMRGRTLKLEHEKKMQDLIDVDSLTGALSLQGFRKRATELLIENPDIQYVIAYNNIRNFKYINDAFGMELGDELLKFWIDRSKSVMTEKEAIGRIDADHVVVLRKAGGERQLAKDEGIIFTPMREYFASRGKEIRVQFCSGIYVVSPEDHKTPNVDHMMDCARVAEKKVRDTKKAGFGFYNPEQWQKGQLIADVCGHLSIAMENEEIKVWYQPQMDYKTGQIVGAEALCRWKHATLGWLSPGDFIPILEDAGLIYELDSFVWDRVCRDLKKWKDEGHPRSVSVNLSRSDISKEHNIPGHFYNLIKKYDLSPDMLRIEITETAYADDPELLINTTRQLKEFGFRVEMDDFGSGYSSLHMLKDVPVDRIKLDLHFLTENGDVDRGQIVVSNVIKMVNALGMDVIAEGVEKVEQADFLKDVGCVEMQGYYFHKPMPVGEFEESLV
ncbi:MAG: EAL domain-containing protein [Lachnospiraceae bacterium]|nr:EAL domain-containing protein [Lachnospiraceae bacterium]